MNNEGDREVRVQVAISAAGRVHGAGVYFSEEGVSLSGGARSRVFDSALKPPKSVKAFCATMGTLISRIYGILW